MPDLKIEISADIGNVTQQVQKVKKELVDLGEGAEKATVELEKISPVLVDVGTTVVTTARKVDVMGDSLVDLGKDAKTASTAIYTIHQPAVTVQKDLAQTAIQAVKADSALAKIGGSGANQAAFALQNVGRVAQDLPFGFIGIQNNLNPLLESFQRLRAETGSNVGALKALGSSLIGAGGLGLALSVVSSAILIYQKYFSDATDTTEKGTEALKAITTSYDQFAKELEQVTAAMGTEAAKVSILFSALSDSNIGLRERKGILEQLNQISPGYLGQLDKEKAAYDDIAKAVFAYTESLAKSSEIKALLPQVDKLFQSLINAQVQLNQLRRFQGGDPNAPGFFGLSPEDFKSEEAALLNTIKNFTNQIKQAKAGLTNFAGGELSLSEILFGKTPELTKAKAEVETIQTVLEKLARQIHELNAEEVTFGFDKSKDKIAAIEGAIKQLVTKFKVAPEDTIIQKLFGDIKELQPLLDHVFGKAIKIKTSAEILFDLEQAQKEADKTIGNKKLKTKIQIETDIKGSDKESVQEGWFPSTTQYANARKQHALFIKQVEQANQDMADNLRKSLDSTFVSIGESIADSISSGGNLGQTIFGGLFKIIGAGIKQLGEAMIALGTAKIGLEKFKFAPGIGTVIAGIAAVAIGSLLQRAIPGFASGVTNFRGGLAVVGERGPELVRLPRGSDVIPNHLIGGVGQASTSVFIPDIKLRGSDLYVVFNRASQTIGRNG